MHWSLTEEDIEYISGGWTAANGTVHDEQHRFIEENALAHLLMNNVVFVNSHWWQKELPEKFQEEISFNVECNDVFAWGYSDAERLPYEQIEILYRMWKKDPEWGAAIWCMIQRKEMPQKPVEKQIRAAGIWDLDSLELLSNTTEAKISFMFASQSDRN
jgi:hypothetical protein